jgi:hypothetical protein
MRREGTLGIPRGNDQQGPAGSRHEPPALPQFVRRQRKKAARSRAAKLAPRMGAAPQNVSTSPRLKALSPLPLSVALPTV